MLYRASDESGQRGRPSLCEVRPAWPPGPLPSRALGATAAGSPARAVPLRLGCPAPGRAVAACARKQQPSCAAGGFSTSGGLAPLCLARRAGPGAPQAPRTVSVACDSTAVSSENGVVPDVPLGLAPRCDLSLQVEVLFFGIAWLTGLSSGLQQSWAKLPVGLYLSSPPVSCSCSG